MTSDMRVVVLCIMTILYVVMNAILNMSLPSKTDSTKVTIGKTAVCVLAFLIIVTSVWCIVSLWR